MDREYIEKLAAAFVAGCIGDEDARRGAEKAVDEFKVGVGRSVHISTGDVIDLCRAVVRVATRASEDETSENAIYAAYLEAFYAARNHGRIAQLSGFYVRLAAETLGMIDGQRCEKLKTRKELLSAVDALFDGDPPREKPSVHVSATIGETIMVADSRAPTPAPAA